MKQSWLKGARTPEEKEQVRTAFNTARPALAILEKYLEERIQEVQRTRDSAEFHSGFQYSEHQNRAAGSIAAYRKMLSHIKQESSTEDGE